MPADNYLTRQDITLASTQLRLQSITSDKEYGVHIKYSPKQLQIHYKIKVNRNQQKVTLFKERVFINNKGVERVVEQMFEKMDKTMYPLELMTTSNGKIDSISNDTEIVKRWKEDTLPKLKQYYQSKVSDDIITKVDKAFTAIDENRDLLDRNLFYKGRKSVEYEILYPKIALAASWFYELVDPVEYPPLIGRQGLGLDISLKAEPLVGITIKWDLLELLCRRHPIAYAILKAVDTLIYILADDDSAITCDFSVTGQIDTEIDWQYNMLAGCKDLSVKGKSAINAELLIDLKLVNKLSVFSYEVVANRELKGVANIGLGIQDNLGVDSKGIYIQKDVIFEGIKLVGGLTAKLDINKKSKPKQKLDGIGGEVKGEITMLAHTFSTDKIYFK